MEFAEAGGTYPSIYTHLSTTQESFVFLGVLIG
jgi:hypothetical protein